MALNFSSFGETCLWPLNFLFLHPSGLSTIFILGGREGQTDLSCANQNTGLYSRMVHRKDLDPFWFHVIGTFLPKKNGINVCHCFGIQTQATLSTVYHSKALAILHCLWIPSYLILYSRSVASVIVAKVLAALILSPVCWRLNSCCSKWIYVATWSASCHQETVSLFMEFFFFPLENMLYFLK